MVAQPSVLPGVDPKYVAEIWWRIGDWEFDQLDLRGGVVDTEPSAVWDYNRSASAYTHSMQFKKPPLFGVALYKYAWTLFKQQRYDAAVREFVHLLNYTDEQEKLTGDPGADFRQEAYTYIAGSLDNFDFVGPGPDEPYIGRPDILDTARSPAEAEAKLRIAHRSRAGRAHRPAGQALDDRDLQGARPRVPDHQPVQERPRHVPAHAGQVADGPLGAGQPERDRRGLRPAREADEGGARAQRLRAEGARGAHGALEVHRRRAVGRREQGQPRRAAARRGARTHGPQGRGRHAHAQRAGGARVGRPDGRSEGEAAAHDLRAPGVQARGDRLARLPQARRERARRLQEPLLLRGRAPQPGSPGGGAAPVRSEALPGADVAGDRDRRARGGRRPRLGRGRPVHRQRGSLRRRPRRRRPRSRLPALAGLGRDAGRRAPQGPEARGAGRATRRSSSTRSPTSSRRR